MIYYFFGKDSFLTKLAADKKSSELRAQGYKKVILESIEDLKEITKSGSLFSEKKCFVFITEKLKEADKKSFKEIIFPDSGDIFIFVEKSATPSLLFGRTRVEKIKTGELDEKWLKTQAKELGIEIDKALINYFLNQNPSTSLRAGSWDAGYFYFELLKLSLYKPGAKLSLVNYMEVSQGKEELNYFDWIKAVLEKNTAKALKFAPSEIGEALMRLKSLINIFELLLVVEDQSFRVNPSTSLRTAQKEFLSRNNPYWVRNLCQWASKMSYQKKLESLEELLDFEVKIKTGRLSSVEALKLFII